MLLCYLYTNQILPLVLNRILSKKRDGSVSDSKRWLILLPSFITHAFVLFVHEINFAFSFNSDPVEVKGWFRIRIKNADLLLLHSFITHASLLFVHEINFALSFNSDPVELRNGSGSGFKTLIYSCSPDLFTTHALVLFVYEINFAFSFNSDPAEFKSGSGILNVDLFLPYPPA